MNIFLDTEFSELGPKSPLYLLSVGMVKETGEEYYAEVCYERLPPVNNWVRENVLPQFTGPKKSRQTLCKEIVEFAGGKPMFWGYYADYDWVVLCQLFGTMMDLPKGWPMYCHDLKSLCDLSGFDTASVKQPKGEHHALVDARWNLELYTRWMINLRRGKLYD